MCFDISLMNLIWRDIQKRSDSTRFFFWKLLNKQHNFLQVFSFCYFVLLNNCLIKIFLQVLFVQQNPTGLLKSRKILKFFFINIPQVQLRTPIFWKNISIVELHQIFLLVRHWFRTCLVTKYCRTTSFLIEFSLNTYYIYIGWFLMAADVNLEIALKQKCDQASTHLPAN